MRQFAAHQALVALTLILSLGSCGQGSEQGNDALASLDTRLAANEDHGGQDLSPSPEAQDAGTRLGSLAEAQRSGAGRAGPVQALATAAGRTVGGCGARGLVYGDQWAQAMPAGLTLYPGARLTEAAGTDSGRCALRVMSFTTADSPESVVVHYAAAVREAGFDAERQPCRTEIRLGGTRASDDAAYMLFARRGARGMTEVDIVASAGPGVT